jgi:hypothetical protein
MHLDDGQLKALIDDALPNLNRTPRGGPGAESAAQPAVGADSQGEGGFRGAAERVAWAEHLKQCRTCSRRAEELAAGGERVNALLSALTRVEVSSSAQAALRRFHSRYDRQKEVTVLNRIFDKPLRPVWAGVIVIALLAVSMSFAPVRAWAGQFLGLFRVQSVEVLPVDTTLMDQLTGNSALSQQIGKLLSSSVTYTKKPSKPQIVSSAAEATQLAGFRVRLPASRTDVPQLVVSKGSAFQFVVDRKMAQAVLDQAGRSDLQLPASLDGTTIKLNIPAGVSAAYGDCPSPQELANEQPASGSPGRRFNNCIILAQIPSPTVDTPPDLDIQKLAVLGLEFSGMKADQAQAYAQTVDWTSTLVIPVPRNAASYKQVQVDGVTGYLIQRPVDDAPQYALIWVNKGIVYAVGGLGTNTAPAVQMANSLK